MKEPREEKKTSKRGIVSFYPNEIKIRKIMTNMLIVCFTQTHRHTHTPHTLYVRIHGLLRVEFFFSRLFLLLWLHSLHQQFHNIFNSCSRLNHSGMPFCSIAFFLSASVLFCCIRSMLLFVQEKKNILFLFASRSHLLGFQWNYTAQHTGSPWNHTRRRDDGTK